jgi:hypothetical protein
MTSAACLTWPSQKGSIVASSITWACYSFIDGRSFGSRSTVEMKAIGREREFAAMGGLASFGEEGLDLYLRLAAHVDKILKGAPVAEIPVEQAAKFELVLNQQTAKALGVTIPLALLARADEVIE